MTTIAQDLGTVYFQLSAVGVGALAVGIEDIRERIYNVLNTIPGTDPLRPLFGSYVYLYNDKPQNTAIPNIKKEVYAALALWMPEIQIKSITHTLEDFNQLSFNITYLLIDDDLIDSVIWTNGDISGSQVSNGIVITALVPAKFNNGIYRVSFKINSIDVLPLCPVIGFETAPDLLTWINANWGSFGSWYLTGTSLVLYLNSGIADTASLIVTETALLTLSKIIPVLATGSYYNLAFTVDGVDAIPPFDGTGLNTPDQLLLWVQTNWSGYGSWYLATGETVITETGDYADDYSYDYSITSQYPDTALVFQSQTATAATLNFI